jgi:Spy/CpxP family protein refolding chaperone
MRRGWVAGLALLAGLGAGAAALAAEAGIKALTAEQVRGYLAGEGQGLALAAELNGYPGPRHVLDLAGPLGLTPEQRRRTEALFQAMQGRAVALGRALVERERTLDVLFAGGAATEVEVSRLVGEIAALAGQLRLAHLSTHLAQRELLSPEQVRRYAQLRGHAAPDRPAEGGHRGH